MNAARGRDDFPEPQAPLDDALARAIRDAGLDPDACVPSAAGGGVLRVDVPAGRSLPAWAELAKAAPSTKVWPIIRGGAGDVEETAHDPAAILAAVPAGDARQVLRPRFEAERAALAEMSPEMADAADLDRLAAMADASGVNTFGGRPPPRTWPAERPSTGRVGLKTLRGRKGRPSTLLLVPVEHSYDVPAHLGFGGWNDCPEPAVQVAVLRDWQARYTAVPAALTGDVLECVVIKPPQTEADAMRLAAEQWIFCDDIVSQGTQSVRGLALEIWRARTWFFWWD